MIAVIQRVSKGSVSINNNVVSEIGKGYVVLLGICNDDTENDVNKCAEKIAYLRIMADEKNKMNLSIIDVKGEILAVSQFTLCANLKNGRRPDFFPAKKPEEAKKLYELFVSKLKEYTIPVKTGEFAAYMEVNIVNDGPVTIIIDTKK